MNPHHLGTAKQINDGQTGEVVYMNRACPPNCAGIIKNPWQPQPDSEGWWWSTGNSKNLAMTHVNSYDLKIGTSWRGLWQKVIVPELPTRKENLPVEDYSQFNKHDVRKFGELY